MSRPAPLQAEQDVPVFISVVRLRLWTICYSYPGRGLNPASSNKNGLTNAQKLLTFLGRARSIGTFRLFANRSAGVLRSAVGTASLLKFGVLRLAEVYVIGASDGKAVSAFWHGLNSTRAARRGRITGVTS